MYIRLTEVIILLILALASDIKTCRIKNSITAPFTAAGLATNLILNGIAGLKASVVGMLIPFLLLAILYALKMLGAGDIKLFCALGSIMGVEFGVYSIAYSFLAGGIVAVLLVCIRKNGFKRMKYLLEYLKNCMITLSLQPYGEFKDNSDGSKFRFAYAIVFGTIVQLGVSFFSPDCNQNIAVRLFPY